MISYMCTVCMYTYYMTVSGHLHTHGLTYILTETPTYWLTHLCTDQHHIWHIHYVYGTEIHIVIYTCILCIPIYTYTCVHTIMYIVRIHLHTDRHTVWSVYMTYHYSVIIYSDISVRHVSTIRHNIYRYNILSCMVHVYT